MKCLDPKRGGNPLPDLPKGARKTDLIRPGEYKNGKGPKVPFHKAMAYGKGGESYMPHEYALWYTERFGWVLPTLLISRGKGVNPDRYYGITVGGTKETGLTYAQKRDREPGGQVRIGNGPHVLHTVTVYIKKKDVERLQFLIDLHNQGLVSANETRDSISTKRARTASRRNLDHLWG